MQTVLVGYLDAYQVIVAVARCDALLSALIEHLHRGWTTVIVVRLAHVSLGATDSRRYDVLIGRCR